MGPLTFPVPLTNSLVLMGQHAFPSLNSVMGIPVNAMTIQASPSQCNNCSDDHLFKCQIDSFDVCIDISWICDGGKNCDDESDESSSLCSPPCSTDTFACEDGSKCIPKANFCNGLSGCDDFSHNFPSQCGNCSADHLFRCQRSGVDVCMNVWFKCDGEKHCDDWSDEIVSECPNCLDDPSMFTCRSYGHEVCMSKDRFQCDGHISCEDNSDEFPLVCDNCSRSGLALCRDESRCVKTSDLCDGIINCGDGSDESDTWSNCTYCTEEGSVPCPGFLVIVQSFVMDLQLAQMLGMNYFLPVNP